MAVRGTIKALKGTYGFIETDDGDRFFAGASIVRPLQIEDLKIGDFVRFREQPDPRGIQAVRVTLCTADEW